jgi:ubiquinone/menaquinone biosynthesis C-methylase UbiE
VSSPFDPVNYKLAAMQNWNAVASDYHYSWAGVGKGPFKSTSELVRIADIKQNDRVLDVACGTGAVTSAVMQRLGSPGLLIGIDFSSGALRIAKLSTPYGQFFQMDAEYIGLHTQFDKILCQYALMFFPNSHLVLASLRNLLRPSGRLSVAVHGTPDGVRYFSTIMEPVLKSIPDIRPAQAPTVHRFGNPTYLEDELSRAGYQNVTVRKMTFEYQAGTFEQYWSDYLATTANSIRKRIEQDESILSTIKSQAGQRALAFTENGKITFPWDVLIATAEK